MTVVIPAENVKEIFKIKRVRVIADKLVGGGARLLVQVKRTTIGSPYESAIAYK